MDQFITFLVSTIKKMNSAPSAKMTSTTSLAINLNDDILMEILIRLPLKSLIRLRCVCKAWHNLISHPNLIQRLPFIKSAIFYHINTTSQAKETRYACTMTSNTSLTYCNFDFFPFHQSSNIIDCCNGLILCHTSLPSTTFFVINPSVREWVALPKSNKRSQLSILAFDPSHSLEFRVIAFTSWLTQGAELEVFSSITCTWVEHRVQWSSVDTNTMSSTMSYFGGKLYILCLPNCVLCIDLVANMNCLQIELPELAKNEGKLARCNECLHYVQSDGDQMRIWMLNKSGNWVLKFSVNVRNMVNIGSSFEASFWTKIRSSRVEDLALNQVRFLTLHPVNEVAYLCLQGKTLLSYDLNENKIEEVYEFGKQKENDHLVHIWLFPFSRYLTNSLSKFNK